mgnify:CR=1 FL=1
MGEGWGGAGRPPPHAGPPPTGGCAGSPGRRAPRPGGPPTTGPPGLAPRPAPRLKRQTLGDRLSTWIRHRIEPRTAAATARPMGWRLPTAVADVVEAAGPWVRDALEAETVLTVGAALDSWRRKEVDGVLSVGPLEGMPNKLAETPSSMLCTYCGTTVPLAATVRAPTMLSLTPKPGSAYIMVTDGIWYERPAMSLVTRFSVQE